jgi:hypothetical protein
MSFSLGSLVSTAGTAIGAVTQLFGGAGAVTLGDVTFSGIEVPEKITWGGRQSTSRQVSPGGAVNVSNMGIIYPPIRWSGYFEGFTALSRSRLLYQMLNDGAPVTLSWNDKLYTVNIIEYAADDGLPGWVPYRITCDVIADQTLAGASASPSLLSSVASDLGSALGITPDDLSAVGTAITQAQTVAQAIGTLTGGSAAALQLQGALSTAQGIAGSAQALSEGNLGGVVASAAAAGDGVFPAGTGAKGVAALGVVTQAAGDLAALPAIGGYIGRALTNVGNASP